MVGGPQLPPLPPPVLITTDQQDRRALDQTGDEGGVCRSDLREMLMAARGAGACVLPMAPVAPEPVEAPSSVDLVEVMRLQQSNGPTNVVNQPRPEPKFESAELVAEHEAISAEVHGLGHPVELAASYERIRAEYGPSVPVESGVVSTEAAFITAVFTHPDWTPVTDARSAGPGAFSQAVREVRTLASDEGRTYAAGFLYQRSKEPPKLEPPPGTVTFEQAHYAAASAYMASASADVAVHFLEEVEIDTYVEQLQLGPEVFQSPDDTLSTFIGHRAAETALLLETLRAAPDAGVTDAFSRAVLEEAATTALFLDSPFQSFGHELSFAEGTYDLEVPARDDLTLGRQLAFTLGAVRAEGAGASAQVPRLVDAEMLGQHYLRLFETGRALLPENPGATLPGHPLARAGQAADMLMPHVARVDPMHARWFEGAHPLYLALLETVDALDRVELEALPDDAAIVFSGSTTPALDLIDGALQEIRAELADLPRLSPADVSQPFEAVDAPTDRHRSQAQTYLEDQGYTAQNDPDFDRRVTSVAEQLVAFEREYLDGRRTVRHAEAEALLRTLGFAPEEDDDFFARVDFVASYTLSHPGLNGGRPFSSLRSRLGLVEPERATELDVGFLMVTGRVSEADFEALPAAVLSAEGTPLAALQGMIAGGLDGETLDGLNPQDRARAERILADLDHQVRTEDLDFLMSIDGLDPKTHFDALTDHLYQWAVPEDGEEAPSRAVFRQTIEASVRDQIDGGARPWAARSLGSLLRLTMDARALGDGSASLPLDRALVAHDLVYDVLRADQAAAEASSGRDALQYLLTDLAVMNLFDREVAPPLAAAVAADGAALQQDIDAYAEGARNVAIFLSAGVGGIPLATLVGAGTSVLRESRHGYEAPVDALRPALGGAVEGAGTAAALAFGGRVLGPALANAQGEMTLGRSMLHAGLVSSMQGGATILGRQITADDVHFDAPVAAEMAGIFLGGAILPHGPVDRLMGGRGIEGATSTFFARGLNEAVDELKDEALEGYFAALFLGKGLKGSVEAARAGYHAWHIAWPSFIIGAFLGDVEVRQGNRLAARDALDSLTRQNVYVTEPMLEALARTFRLDVEELRPFLRQPSLSEEARAVQAARQLRTLALAGTQISDDLLRRVEADYGVTEGSLSGQTIGLGRTTVAGDPAVRKALLDLRAGREGPVQDHAALRALEVEHRLPAGTLDFALGWSAAMRTSAHPLAPADLYQRTEAVAVEQTGLGLTALEAAHGPAAVAMIQQQVLRALREADPTLEALGGWQIFGVSKPAWERTGRDAKLLSPELLRRIQAAGRAAKDPGPVAAFLPMDEVTARLDRGEPLPPGLRIIDTQAPSELRDPQVRAQTIDHHEGELASERTTTALLLLEQIDAALGEEAVDLDAFPTGEVTWALAQAEAGIRARDARHLAAAGLNDVERPVDRAEQVRVARALLTVGRDPKDPGGGSRITRYSTDNVGDGMTWPGYILRSLPEVIADPELRATIAEASLFEDYEVFGGAFSLDAEELSEGQVLQAALFLEVDRVLGRLGLTGTDRVPAEHAPRLAAHFPNAIAHLLASPDRAKADAQRFLDAVREDRDLLRARGVVAGAELVGPDGETIMSTIDLDRLGAEGRGPFRTWAAVPHVGGEPLQLTVRRQPDDRWQNIVARPDGRALPGGGDLTAALGALQRAEQQAAEHLGKPAGHWFGRANVALPIGGSVLTPAEVAGIIDDVLHLTDGARANEAPPSHRPEGLAAVRPLQQIGERSFGVRSGRLVVLEDGAWRTATPRDAYAFVDTAPELLRMMDGVGSETTVEALIEAQKAATVGLEATGNAAIRTRLTHLLLTKAIQGVELAIEGRELVVGQKNEREVVLSLDRLRLNDLIQPGGVDDGYSEQVKAAADVLLPRDQRARAFRGVMRAFFHRFVDVGLAEADPSTEVMVRDHREGRVVVSDRKVEFRVGDRAASVPHYPGVPDRVLGIFAEAFLHHSTFAKALVEASKREGGDVHPWMADLVRWYTFYGIGSGSAADIMGQNMMEGLELGLMLGVDGLAKKIQAGSLAPGKIESVADVAHLLDQPWFRTVLLHGMAAANGFWNHQELFLSWERGRIPEVEWDLEGDPTLTKAQIARIHASPAKTHKDGDVRTVKTMSSRGCPFAGRVGVEREQIVLQHEDPTSTSFLSREDTRALVEGPNPIGKPSKAKGGRATAIEELDNPATGRLWDTFFQAVRQIAQADPQRALVPGIEAKGRPELSWVSTDRPTSDERRAAELLTTLQGRRRAAPDPDEHERIMSRIEAIEDQDLSALALVEYLETVPISKVTRDPEGERHLVTILTTVGVESVTLPSSVGRPQSGRDRIRITLADGARAHLANRPTTLEVGGLSLSVPGSRGERPSRDEALFGFLLKRAASRQHVLEMKGPNGSRRVMRRADLDTFEHLLEEIGDLELRDAALWMVLRPLSEVQARQVRGRILASFPVSGAEGAVERRQVELSSGQLDLVGGKLELSTKTARALRQRIERGLSVVRLEGPSIRVRQEMRLPEVLVAAAQDGAAAIWGGVGRADQHLSLNLALGRDELAVVEPDGSLTLRVLEVVKDPFAPSAREAIFFQTALATAERSRGREGSFALGDVSETSWRQATEAFRAAFPDAALPPFVRREAHEVDRPPGAQATTPHLDDLSLRAAVRLAFAPLDRGRKHRLETALARLDRVEAALHEGRADAPELLRFWRQIVRDASGRFSELKGREHPGRKEQFSGHQPTPNLRDEAVRRYIEKSVSSRRFFLEGLAAGHLHGSGGEAISFFSNMHRRHWYRGGEIYIEGGGDVGHASAGSLDRLNPSGVTFNTHFVEEALDRIAAQLGDGYLQSKERTIEVEGIEPSFWPQIEHHHYGTLYVYPPTNAVRQAFRSAQSHLATLLGLGADAPAERIVQEIGQTYYYWMFSHPFGDLNHSLFMNAANALLELHGLKGIEHGIIDFATLGLSPKTFTAYFQAEVARQNRGKVPPPRPAPAPRLEGLRRSTTAAVRAAERFAEVRDDLLSKDISAERRTRAFRLYLAALDDLHLAARRVRSASSRSKGGDAGPLKQLDRRVARARADLTDLEPRIVEQLDQLLDDHAEQWIAEKKQSIEELERLIHRVGDNLDVIEEGPDSRSAEERRRRVALEPQLLEAEVFERWAERYPDSGIPAAVEHWKKKIGAVAGTLERDSPSYKITRDFVDGSRTRFVRFAEWASPRGETHRIGFDPMGYGYVLSPNGEIRALGEIIGGWPDSELEGLLQAGLQGASPWARERTLQLLSERPKLAARIARIEVQEAKGPEVAAEIDLLYESNAWSVAKVLGRIAAEDARLSALEEIARPAKPIMRLREINPSAKATLIEMFARPEARRRAAELLEVPLPHPKPAGEKPARSPGRPDERAGRTGGSKRAPPALGDLVPSGATRRAMEIAVPLEQLLERDGGRRARVACVLAEKVVDELSTVPVVSVLAQRPEAELSRLRRVSELLEVAAAEASRRDAVRLRSVAEALESAIARVDATAPPWLTPAQDAPVDASFMVVRIPEYQRVHDPAFTTGMSEAITDATESFSELLASGGVSAGDIAMIMAEIGTKRREIAYRENDPPPPEDSPYRRRFEYGRSIAETLEDMDRWYIRTGERRTWASRDYIKRDPNTRHAPFFERAEDFIKSHGPSEAAGELRFSHPHTGKLMRVGGTMVQRRSADEIMMVHPKLEDSALIEEAAYQELAEWLSDPHASLDNADEVVGRVLYMLMHGTPYELGSPSMVYALFDAALRARFGVTLPRFVEGIEPFWEALFRSEEEFVERLPSFFEARGLEAPRPKPPEQPSLPAS